MRDYDLDGRLIRQSLGPDQRELSYNAVGNITAINGGVTDSVFAYDDLDRLASANDPDYNLSWEYDANGNRIDQTDSLTGNSTDYTIDTASNRLLAVGGTPYQHDANGNLLQNGSNNYQYNARDRLVSVDQGATGEYLYNALGQRVYKWAMLESGADPDLNGDGQITEADLHSFRTLSAKAPTRHTPTSTATVKWMEETPPASPPSSARQGQLCQPVQRPRTDARPPRLPASRPPTGAAICV